MLLKSRTAVVIAAIAFFLIFINTASAGNLTSLDVQSTTFVPGEEGRYTLVFKSSDLINLSVGSSVYVDFPQGFSLIRSSIDSEDPGCTLANIQYKNKPSDKFWSVLQGETSVVEAGGLNRFIFNPSNANSTVNPDVNVYLVIPGVINKKPAAGTETVALTVYDKDGKDYTGSAPITLGDPPAAEPEGLNVTAVNSTKVNAVWEAVYEADRYQLFYSSDPEGTFIQACDFGKEPDPGQEWSLTGTDCSYSGIGNGGLAAGMTYYFKVRAGNQYGFGPFSQDVAVSMPVVTLKKSSPADNADDVSTGSVITAVLDQPVKITDVDKIQVYEKSTGSPVTKEQVEAIGTSVNITASLMKSTEYQVVFYNQALESEGNQGVYNRLFGWSFTTKSHGDGGDGGGDSVSDKDGADSYISGSTTNCTDTGIAKAIENAASSKKVTFNTSGASTFLNVTLDQLETIKASGYKMEVIVESAGVAFILDPSVLTDSVQGAVKSFSIGAKIVDSGAQPAGGSFKIAGKVFELSVLVETEDGKTQIVSRLVQNITVALPVTDEAKAAALNGTLDAAYYDQSTGNWVPINNGKYDVETNAYLFQTSHLSKWALIYKEQPPTTVTFSDVQGHWAQKEIEYMAGKGYLKGVGNGLFSPESSVTRAEFAAMLVRCLGLDEGDTCPFTDVPENAWFRESVSKAYSAGIVKGLDENTFDPGASISREQLATMTANAMRYKNLKTAADKASLDQFADKDQISQWAVDSCAVAVEKEIVKGYNGFFGPKETATRAQAAAMLYRLLNILYSQGGE